MMNSNLIRCLHMFLLISFLSACSTSPKTHLYSLNTEHNSREVAENISIAVWKVKLPEIIDRPEIVTRTGPNTVKRADFHRWAGDLSENIGLLIAKEVSYNLKTDYVDVFPWATHEKFDYQVKVHIRKFDGELGANSELSGIYLVIDGETNKVLEDKAFFFNENVSGEDYGSMVAIMSKLIVQLSDEISKTISAQVVLKNK